ncbi:MAG: hypothetical protein HFI66_05235 [Lachnospiraceae bacterium]|jgi:hypothetical protein|nr:hypothetical protein [Lachnospiraceae bacterium]
MTEQAASENIYTWSGRYHFLKPQRHKKSILLIDGQKGEVSLNGHVLEPVWEEADTYRLTASNHVYHLKFYSLKSEDMPNQFTGQIISGQEAKEETEGIQEEWYETHEAESFSMAMTIIGVFDLLLSLVLLAKDHISERKEAPEKEQDRQDIRETKRKINEVSEALKKSVELCVKDAGRKALLKKTEQLADLVDNKIISKIQEEMAKSTNPPQKLSEDIKKKISDEYKTLLKDQVNSYANEVKSKYFEPLGLEYNSSMADSVIAEISEYTYQNVK